MCRPVMKWVHVIILFFKGPYWLFCQPQSFFRPQMFLDTCPFLIIRSVNVKQFVLARSLTHVSLINLRSLYSSHLCLMSLLWSWLHSALPFNKVLTVKLTVLSFHDLDCAWIPWEKIKCAFHQVGLVPLAIMSWSVPHCICPRDLRPCRVTSVFMFYRCVCVPQCNSMHAFLWKCPRIFIILDIVQVQTCFDES